MPDLDASDEDMQRLQGIIDSMTPDERRNPDKIDMSRRRRIADGSGTDPADVNKLIKQFDQVRPMMKQMAAMSLGQRFKALSGLSKMGAFMPGAQFKTKERSHRKSARERLKERQMKKRMEKRRKKKDR